MPENIMSPITTKKVPLTEMQKGWIDQACSLINEERMRLFNRDLTSIHSPTGNEKNASKFVVDHLRGLGLDAKYQAVD